MKTTFAICSLLAAFCSSAYAAGTYMGTSGYQSPQKYYGGTATGGGYYQPQYRGTSGYSTVAQNPYAQASRVQQVPAASPKMQTQDGFFVNAGISHKYSQWNFDMKETGSVLDYSNIGWNILDVNGGYNYGKFVFDAGFEYGVQSGTGKMTDDDITSGGIETPLYDSGTGAYVGSTHQKVLSIGDAKGGDLFGLHFGVGLRNMFGFGKTKIVPSIGYRMFGYQMVTANGSGLSVANNVCYDSTGGQTYCPALIWYNGGATMTADADDISGGYYWWDTSGSGSLWISNGDTYSFHQTDKTHIYDVSWNGPYLAVEMESEINADNFLTARLELGFPSYSAEGDQPYRSDWEHPKSVEDSKDMFGATHLGMLASWTTMISNSWGLSLGMTYDYYNVSGADAEVNMNGDYYTDILQDIFDQGVIDGDWTNDDAGWDTMSTTNPTAMAINDLYTSCDNSWSCTTKSEVNSFYQSIGVRLGVVGKF